MKYKYLIHILSIALALALVSCIEDKSRYDYREANDVTFKSVLEGYAFTRGEEAEIVAPVEFSVVYSDESRIDEDFDIGWYTDAGRFATGYRIKYTFETVGGFSIYLKVENRSTGETYVSDAYTANSKSSFGWGWFVLSADSQDNSCLSFISPVSLRVDSGLENDIDGGLGTDPKRLFHYYVDGSIPDSYISGLPKLIVNQGSGTLTLDGNSLQPDKWMRDEFETGTEPEEDFTMSSFAWKGNYYLILTESGNVYLRCMQKSSSITSIPYYNTYSAMPYTFDGGMEVGAFQPFHNVTYWTADEDNVVLYDQRNSRFVAFVPGSYGDTYEEYCPKVVYFSYYDADGEFDPSVPKVNEMGAGTKCLGIGAYEKVYKDPEYGALDFYSDYVALMDYGGTGNCYVYQFTVNPMGSSNHLVTANVHTAFSGSALLTENSVVRMSSNFEKNPYFYFTDGGNNLYVYSMEAQSHHLLYTASSRITEICPSPVVCEFSKYGGNSATPNFRLAVAQEGGKIGIVDVSSSKMVRLFEGFDVNVDLGGLSGFGDIRSVVWATNYQGEY